MNASRRISALALSMLIALAAAPPVAAQAPPKTKTKTVPTKTTVPFELLASNHMVVKARVNGAGPYRLVFDLGVAGDAPQHARGDRGGHAEKRRAAFAFVQHERA